MIAINVAIESASKIITPWYGTLYASMKGAKR